jgi:hypothetical protein
MIEPIYQYIEIFPEIVREGTCSPEFIKALVASECESILKTGFR